MTKEEYKQLIVAIRTAINMCEVSRLAKNEAIEEINKVLIKKVDEKKK